MAATLPRLVSESSPSYRSACSATLATYSQPSCVSAISMVTVCSMPSRQNNGRRRGVDSTVDLTTSPQGRRTSFHTWWRRCVPRTLRNEIRSKIRSVDEEGRARKVEGCGNPCRQVSGSNERHAETDGILSERVTSTWASLFFLSAALPWRSGNGKDSEREIARYGVITCQERQDQIRAIYSSALPHTCFRIASDAMHVGIFANF